MDTKHHHKESHEHAMSHGSAEQYLRRFWIVTFLLVPLVLVHPTISEILGITFGLNKWIQFGIATIVFGFALVFFRHAWHEIRSRRYGMMTLVSLAVGSGYLFSVASTFIAVLNVEFYLEISTLVWVLLFGHYLEVKSSSAAGDALSEVAKLLPKKAHRLENGIEADVDIAELHEGDIVVVKPGEKIPADGTIIKGFANVDESLISGESKPVRKEGSAEVIAGAICLDGSLTVLLSRVGEHSTVGQIQKLIAQAGQTKPRSQKIADKASAVLTFVAGITALGTLLVWTLFIGQPFVFAITLAITVLVIACPHALGLAIPTVTTITTSLAVKNGFFIKDLSKIEVIRKADYVVFDKTGTLTKGEFGVTGIVLMEEQDKDKILSTAASLEQHSSHIIGQSILKYARDQKVQVSDIDDFQNIAGQGVKAKISGREYVAGNERLMRSLNIKFDLPKNMNGTIVFVASKGNLLGHIVLSDAIKQSSYDAVKKLHSMGVKVAMLTGDNEQVAGLVSKELGIDTYFANVLPEDKYTHIKQLQEQGNTVLMVGDGVNDAPALTQADAGIAIGAGTDVAVESGDVVLIDNDPLDIVRLITLSKKVYTKMIQNLVWALGYNIIAIPMAAGVFAVWGFFLRPEIGALVMSFSTVIVVANAMTLKRVKL
ncbi:MAG: heavy metal translocating P-type ATPase [Candidatus Ryanbacteria bacterium CG10_big_fil_rev_8_21_14_0_10_43_42]|uniref:Heavy metal translocating P-type ATPase n=1 Tax=Candidatus Ryanbacteria bacterium CG10_big_fil_rev_8_21_14_0_10_43_42 TaxID=1974864 RepID=A0A2M8KVV1_9BACT|nr:MAG: heavy metal translocating P-type ATPase [Candidatus Ryanbacteria bacterium CG10_big_fil_rev_8_21_14_0_10_43_42]